MKRRQFFEWEDYQWFPSVIRDGETDYLRFMIEKFNIYKPIFPILKEVLHKTGETNIVDLCSGGGGACTKMSETLSNPSPEKYKILLTDKFPNVESFSHIKSFNPEQIDFSDKSIDATEVPSDVNGMRTIFSAFHHFEPERAKKILKNAVDAGKPIGIFEGGERSIIDMLGVIFTTPLSFFFFTPFMKPLKLSRFILTYLIPLIPLTTIWDGIVSMFRMYTPDELLEMARSVEPEKYEWRSGRIPHGVSKVIYLVGYPVSIARSPD